MSMKIGLQNCHPLSSTSVKTKSSRHSLNNLIYIKLTKYLLYVQSTSTISSPLEKLQNIHKLHVLYAVMNWAILFWVWCLIHQTKSLQHIIYEWELCLQWLCYIFFHFSKPVIDLKCKDNFEIWSSIWFFTNKNFGKSSLSPGITDAIWLNPKW